MSLVSSKELQVFHVLTSHQVADLLTKPLSNSHHAFLLDKIDIWSPSSILWGRADSLSIHKHVTSPHPKIKHQISF